MKTQMNFPLIILVVTMALGFTSLAQQQPPDEATRQIIESCATSANMPARESGTRPTSEQKQLFEACLTEQNVQLPPRPRHRPNSGHCEKTSQPASTGQQTTEGSLEIE